VGKNVVIVPLEACEAISLTHVGWKNHGMQRRENLAPSRKLKFIQEYIFFYFRGFPGLCSFSFNFFVPDIIISKLLVML
jgi:hypothetical protein